MDRRYGRRMAGSAVLSAVWIWVVWTGAAVFASDVGAQQAPTLSDNLVRASLSQLLQSANQRDTDALQTHHLTRLARDLQATVIASLDGAADAEVFPGAEAVADLEDAVRAGGGAASPFDPGVHQGIEELVSWYRIRSWSRGDREECVQEDGRPAGLEQVLDRTNSWWSSPARMPIARRLTHSLALFYERSRLAIAAESDPTPTLACMAEGDRDAAVARLALRPYPTPPREIGLEAQPGAEDRRTQIDLTWHVDVPGDRLFEVEVSGDSGRTWTSKGQTREIPPEFTVRELTPNTTYYVRVGPVGGGAMSDPDTVTTDPAIPSNGGTRWKRYVIPALGAALVTVLLTRDDDDGPRSGTVIVRIPVG